MMNGMDDPIIPFGGGIASLYGLWPAGPVQSMAGTLAHWRRVNDIAGEPLRTIHDDGPDGHVSWVEELRWRGPHDTQVAGFIAHGGGHAVPGGYQYLPVFLVGRTNRDINAADTIWQFFTSSER